MYPVNMVEKSQNKPKENNEKKVNGNLFETFFNEVALNSSQLSSLEYLDQISSDFPLPESIANKFSQPDTKSLNGLPLKNSLGANLTSKRYKSISPNLFLSTSPLPDNSNLKEEFNYNSNFLPKKPINSTQSFTLWYNNLEPFLSQGKEEAYHSHITTINIYRAKAEELKIWLNKLKEALNESLEQYNKIEDGNKNIKEMCYDILKENNELSEGFELIEKELYYFNQLTPIFQFLSSPGSDICHHERFKPTLELLDQCIKFMSDHPTYKDSLIYLNKYQQAMTRALSIIHLNFSENIHTLQLELSTNNLTPTDIVKCQQKLRYLASEFRPLIYEIEKRFLLNNDYHNLLLDCYDTYISFRKAFLNSFITQLANNEDLIASSLDGSAYMSILHCDEESLFRSYFVEGEEELNAYLEVLYKIFYDTLSTKIIKRLNNINKATLTESKEQSELIKVYRFLFEQHETMKSSSVKVIIKELLENMRTFIPTADQLT